MGATRGSLDHAAYMHETRTPYTRTTWPPGLRQAPRPKILTTETEPEATATGHLVRKEFSPWGRNWMNVANPNGTRASAPKGKISVKLHARQLRELKARIWLGPMIDVKYHEQRTHMAYTVSMSPHVRIDRYHTRWRQ